MSFSVRHLATCSGFTAAVLAGLLLTGCATHEAAPTTRTTTSTSKTGTTATPRPAVPRAKAPEASIGESSRSERPSMANMPDHTGIPACDDYLASYIGCHRAAEIFAPGQLQDRYEAMRTSLLRDSQNPDIRPQLAARCNSLATQLRTALHGKACEVSPAPASTTTP